MKKPAVLAFVAAVALANYLTANYAPLTFDWLGQVWIITWGTWMIAATFFLRDAVQVRYGRRTAYAAIGVALVVNVAMSVLYDDLLWVTIGSASAFIVSEALDTEIFTRLHDRLAARIAVSGIVAGTIDSAVFAVVGLSPLTTNIVPWQYLWTTIVAQVVVKTVVQLVAAVPVARRLEPAAA